VSALQLSSSRLFARKQKRCLEASGSPHRIHSAPISRGIMQKLEVITRQIAGLRAYGKQRKNDAAVGRMVDTIEEYGFKIPILVATDGEVIDGDLRVKAAQQMGWTEVPAILADDWTPEQIQGFRLLADESANWAEWNLEAVAQELSDWQHLDFDLELTGFDHDVLLDLLDGEIEIEGLKVDGDDEEDDSSCYCPLCRQKLPAAKQVV